MGQGSPNKAPGIAPQPPVAVEMLPNSKEMEAFWSQGDHPPTPPPSEPGSLSPAQSEDSWDSTDTSQPAVSTAKHPSITLKRKSRLAQVRTHLYNMKIHMLWTV